MILYGPPGGEVPKEYKTWRRLPRLLLGSFRVVWEAAPRQFAISTLLQLVQGAAMAANLLIIRNLLAAVLAGGGRASPDYGPVLVQLSAMVVLNAITGLIGIYQNQQQQLLAELVQQHAAKPVIEVATSIDLQDFDTPEFHDRMRRAQMTATGRPMQVTMAVMSIGRSLLGLAGVALGLLLLSPLLLAITLLGFLPLWFASTSVARAVYEFTREMTANDRRRFYILGLLTAREMAKEVRAFGLAPFLTDRYDRLSDDRIAELRKHLGRRARTSAAGSLGTALVFGITFGVLAWLVVGHHIGLAEAGAAATATFQLGGQLQGMAFAGSQLYESSLFIEDLDSFLTILPSIKAARPTGPAPEGFSRIEVRDVDFSYPVSSPATPSGPNATWAVRARLGQPQELSGTAVHDGHRRPHALRGVALEIGRGEVVALVGENGSGKTTLAKILCGLYRLDSGSVLWDGVDVSGADPDRLRDQVTVIFQDFVRYMLTAQENIGIGRVEQMSDLAAIKRAAEQAGADTFIERWPEAYEAMLGPIFEGGKELSVGQWQRVALARAFFRDAPLIILDEPTASLDARAEADLFARIRSLFRGRSVLLISHRFSSVRSADRIYVLKDGAVVEEGSHERLMERGGLYAELFNLQAAAYFEQSRPESPTAGSGNPENG